MTNLGFCPRHGLVEHRPDLPVVEVEEVTFHGFTDRDGGWDHGADAYRVVPLLRVFERDGEPWCIAVGRVELRLTRGDVLRVRLALEDEHWLCDGGAWKPVPERPDLSATDWYWTVRHELPGDEPQAVLTTVAKALAERTRNQVAQVRRLRVKLEGDLAASIRQAAGDLPLTDVLASLVELGRVAARAAEHTRHGERDQLGLSRTAPDVYHLYRRLLDPRIYRPQDEPAPEALPHPQWLRTHDAAVKQLERATVALDAETGAIHRLLSGAATIATARDAEAAESLNRLAATAAVGIGVPSLVFALFGAESLVGFKGDARWVLLAVAAATFVATVVALSPSRILARRKPWIVAAALSVALAGGLLLLAQVPVPKPPERVCDFKDPSCPDE